MGGLFKLAGLVPAPVMGALRAAALVGLALGVVRVGVLIEQHGADRVQRQWDAVELQRAQAAADQRREDTRIANAASAQHETDRAAIEAALRRSQGALNAALQRPAECGPTASDLVLPGALGVRLNAIRAAGGGAPGPGAAEPAD